MLLTLTWCHCTPADTPTSPCISTISTEHQLDNVACACYLGRQGGADNLISNHNVVRPRGGGAAALLHQGCPVAVRDCQVVVARRLEGGFNVKCRELQRQDQSLLNFYRLCHLLVYWVVVGEVW